MSNKDPFGLFNFSDFKKWMKSHNDKPQSKLIGMKVESKVNSKKIISKIEVQDGEINEVVKDFKKHGGIIKDVDGTQFLIEVKTGSFYVPKTLIKKTED